MWLLSRQSNLYDGEDIVGGSCMLRTCMLLRVPRAAHVGVLSRTVNTSRKTWMRSSSWPAAVPSRRVSNALRGRPYPSTSTSATAAWTSTVLAALRLQLGCSMLQTCVLQCCCVVGVVTTRTCIHALVLRSALQLLRRCKEGGVIWLAPVCSSWVWISRGSSGRSKIMPLGLPSESTAAGTLQVSRRACAPLLAKSS